MKELSHTNTLANQEMAIDNRIEKIRQIFDEQSDELFSGAVTLNSGFEPVTSVFAALKSIFDAQENRHRVSCAVNSLCDELESQRRDLPGNAAEALSQPWFTKAVKILIEEAVRSTSEQEAVLLARAAAHGCFPGNTDSHRQKDLASYIHDLARLGTDDVQVLKLLREGYKEAIRVDPNGFQPNHYTESFATFKKVLERENIHPDDSIAICARLSGFGLAFEVVRNTARQNVSEHCFRPTRRGVYLLSLLDAAEQPRAPSTSAK